MSDAEMRLESLLEGANVPGDTPGTNESPPHWLDRAKFRRGQDFFRKHFFCVYFAHLLSLLVALAWARSLRVLIHTGRSNTPEKAFRRYLSTLLHIKRWYEGDVWSRSDAAHQSVRTVRSVHRRVAQQANSSKEKVAESTCAGHAQLWPLIRQDLQSAVRPPDSCDESAVYVSQLDMAITQYEFVGLVLLCPERIGIYTASEQDLEGFLHFWRGMGYLLGIQDRYNLCSGSLAATKKLCMDVTNRLIAPNLAQFSADSEVMSRALMEGTRHIVRRLSFESMLLYLCWCLGLRLPSFYRALPWYYCFRYWVLRFVFGVLIRIPGVLPSLNRMLERDVQAAQGKVEQRDGLPV